MKTSGLFRIHSHTAEIKQNRPLHLVIFGDVHRDSPAFADGAWRDFLQRAKSLKHALFLGMGDYIDSASSSERACLESSGHVLHDTTRKDLSKLAIEKVKLLGRELAFMKGRLIGLVNGNHYFNFADGTNTDQKLCEALDATYLGVSAFVRLYLCEGSRKFALDIWAHHGAGASRLPGGSINRVEQMREHASADVFIMGHDHKRMVVPTTPIMRLDHSPRSGLILRERQQMLVRSGSFLKSYVDGETSYNVDSARGPCSLGHVEVIITPRVGYDKHGNIKRLELNGLS